MDKTVPAGAALLLDFIRETEAGSAGRESYDVIYAHKQGHLPKPITSMTLLEVQKGQSNRWNGLVASSATGGYQFMYKTLGDLIEELNLNIKQKFDPDLQDRLGYHLLKRRGYHAFMDGRISTNEFAKRLAMEWASFPVLAATDGAHRKLKRGQSYYEGDALNKALVKPEVIEMLLHRVSEAAEAPPWIDDDAPDAIDQVLDDADKPLGKSSTAVATGLGAAAGASAAVKEISDNVSSVADAAPWLLVAVVIAGAAWWILRERRRKAKAARLAKLSRVK